MGEPVSQEKKNKRRVEASGAVAPLCRKQGVNQRGSRRLLHGVTQSFEDQAG